MTIELLTDGPADAGQLLVLAHGAGLDMAAPFMEMFAQGVAAAGIRVVRFNFPYMAEALRSGRKRPPDRMEVLCDSYAEAVDQCVEREQAPRIRLVLGGKSMGGRVATMIADRHGVAGVVCLGYPFHPPKQPQKLRIDHLRDMETPVLICQGERDPFGDRREIELLALSPAIRFHWLPDGDHGFKPRQSSGYSLDENLRDAIAAVCGFIRGLA
jgi:predicted alpha/beta-hydrolase family hydrolase